MLSRARQINTAHLAFAFCVSLVALSCAVVSFFLSSVLGPTAVSSVVVVVMAGAALVGLSLCLLTFVGICVPLYDLIERLSKLSLPKPVQQGWPSLSSAVQSALVDTPTPPPRQVVR